MPELPDVQVLKQYVDATSLHQRIEAIEVYSQQMLEGLDAQELKDRLQGCTFEGTRRYGKYLMSRFPSTFQQIYLPMASCTRLCGRRRG